jgi:hypothetical protein
MKVEGVCHVQGEDSAHAGPHGPTRGDPHDLRTISVVIVRDIQGEPSTDRASQEGDTQNLALLGGSQSAEGLSQEGHSRQPQGESTVGFMGSGGPPDPLSQERHNRQREGSSQPLPWEIAPLSTDMLSEVGPSPRSSGEVADKGLWESSVVSLLRGRRLRDADSAAADVSTHADLAVGSTGPPGVSYMDPPGLANGSLHAGPPSAVPLTNVNPQGGVDGAPANGAQNTSVGLEVEPQLPVRHRWLRSLWGARHTDR